ncbi:hypothetical protein P8C59_000845 [Phyllachora maydis]|uniref:Chitin-binding type-1 domain-containing protein n=1 Tax=Phyllachora maydis TaxID=1825666 RepID=A0AAD9M9E3_9PEZI|nr:hypothetical protein P8C59_000845 [Phyllachora maydis]
MQAFLTLVAASTALALPQHHSGSHRHGHLQPRQPGLDFGPRRAYDTIGGSCGGSTGNTCQEGLCCSPWGYCGQGDAYCGDISTGSTPQTPSPPGPPANVSSAGPSAGPGLGLGLGNLYTFYKGTGATSAGWPSTSAWASFPVLWAANLGTISASCTQFGTANNSPDETAAVQAALLASAAATRVDARFLLAVMMQESKGCVRVPTTNYGVRNPGLLQDHDGAATCNEAAAGGVRNPCPAATIAQMVAEGAAGTAAGDGLKQCLVKAAAGGDEAQRYYMAARIYNSGSLPADGNLVSAGPTSDYASDIANRLTGWTSAAAKHAA